MKFKTTYLSIFSIFLLILVVLGFKYYVHYKEYNKKFTEVINKHIMTVFEENGEIKIKEEEEYLKYKSILDPNIKSYIKFNESTVLKGWCDFIEVTLIDQTITGKGTVLIYYVEYFFLTYPRPIFEPGEGISYKFTKNNDQWEFVEIAYSIDLN